MTKFGNQSPNFPSLNTLQPLCSLLKEVFQCPDFGMFCIYQIALHV